MAEGEVANVGIRAEMQMDTSQVEKAMSAVGDKLETIVKSVDNVSATIGKMVDGLGSIGQTATNAFRGIEPLLTSLTDSLQSNIGAVNKLTTAISNISEQIATSERLQVQASQEFRLENAQKNKTLAETIQLTNDLANAQTRANETSQTVNNDQSKETVKNLNAVADSYTQVADASEKAGEIQKNQNADIIASNEAVIKSNEDVAKSKVISTSTISTDTTKSKFVDHIDLPSNVKEYEAQRLAHRQQTNDAMTQSDRQAAQEQEQISLALQIAREKNANDYAIAQINADKDVYISNQQLAQNQQDNIARQQIASEDAATKITVAHIKANDEQKESDAQLAQSQIFNATQTQTEQEKIEAQRVSVHEHANIQINDSDVKAYEARMSADERLQMGREKNANDRAIAELKANTDLIDLDNKRTIADLNNLTKRQIAHDKNVADIVTTQIEADAKIQASKNKLLQKQLELDAKSRAVQESNEAERLATHKTTNEQIANSDAQIPQSVIDLNTIAQNEAQRLTIHKDINERIAEADKLLTQNSSLSLSKITQEEAERVAAHERTSAQINDIYVQMYEDLMEADKKLQIVRENNANKRVIAQLNADTKQIESSNRLTIAELNNLTKRQTAHENDVTKIVTTQIEADAKMQASNDRLTATIESNKTRELIAHENNNTKKAISDDKLAQRQRDNESRQLITTENNETKRATTHENANAKIYASDKKLEVEQERSAAKIAVAQINALARASKAGQNYFNVMSAGSIASMAGLYRLLSYIRRVTTEMEKLDIIRASYTRIMGAEIGADAVSSASNRMMQNAIAIAYKYGATISDVSGTMVEFARQGKNEREIMTLTQSLGELRLMLASSTGEFMTMSKAMQTATTLMTQMDLSVYQAIDALKLMVEYDIRAATSFEQLDLAMNRFAAAGQVAGMSTEEIVRVAAAFTEIGVGGMRAGTALNTVISRLSGTKVAIDAVENMGVALTTLEGGALRTTSAIERLVEAYQKVVASGNSVQLGKFVTDIAGTRQRSILIAGLNRYIKQTSSPIKASEFKPMITSMWRELEKAFNTIPVNSVQTKTSAYSKLFDAETITNILKDNITKLYTNLQEEYEKTGKVTRPNLTNMMSEWFGVSTEQAQQIIAGNKQLIDTIEGQFNNFMDKAESRFDKIQRLASSTTDEAKKVQDAALEAMTNTITIQKNRIKAVFESAFLNSDFTNSFKSALDQLASAVNDVTKIFLGTSSMLVNGLGAVRNLIPGGRNESNAQAGARTAIDLFEAYFTMRLPFMMGSFINKAFSTIGTTISTVGTNTKKYGELLLNKYYPINNVQATDLWNSIASDKNSLDPNFINPESVKAISQEYKTCSLNVDEFRTKLIETAKTQNKLTTLTGSQTAAINQYVNDFTKFTNVATAFGTSLINISNALSKVATGLSIFGSIVGSIITIISVISTAITLIQRWRQESLETAAGITQFQAKLEENRQKIELYEKSLDKMTNTREELGKSYGRMMDELYTLFKSPRALSDISLVLSNGTQRKDLQEKSESERQHIISAELLKAVGSYINYRSEFEQRKLQAATDNIPFNEKLISVQEYLTNRFQVTGDSVNKFNTEWNTTVAAIIPSFNELDEAVTLCSNAVITATKNMIEQSKASKSNVFGENYKDKSFKIDSDDWKDYISEVFKAKINPEAVIQPYGQMGLFVQKTKTMLNSLGDELSNWSPTLIALLMSQINTEFANMGMGNLDQYKVKINTKLQQNREYTQVEDITKGNEVIDFLLNLYQIITKMDPSKIKILDTALYNALSGTYSESDIKNRNVPKRILDETEKLKNNATYDEHGERTYYLETAKINDIIKAFIEKGKESNDAFIEGLYSAMDNEENLKTTIQTLIATLNNKDDYSQIITNKLKDYDNKRQELIEKQSLTDTVEGTWKDALSEGNEELAKKLYNQALDNNKKQQDILEEKLELIVQQADDAFAEAFAAALLDPKRIEQLTKAFADNSIDIDADVFSKLQAATGNVNAQVTKIREELASAGLSLLEDENKNLNEITQQADSLVILAVKALAEYTKTTEEIKANSDKYTDGGKEAQEQANAKFKGIIDNIGTQLQTIYTSLANVNQDIVTRLLQTQKLADSAQRDIISFVRSKLESGIKTTYDWYKDLNVLGKLKKLKEKLTENTSKAATATNTYGDISSLAQQDYDKERQKAVADVRTNAAAYRKLQRDWEKAHKQSKGGGGSKDTGKAERDLLQQIKNEHEERVQDIKLLYQTIRDEENNIIGYMDRTGSRAHQQALIDEQWKYVEDLRKVAAQTTKNEKDRSKANKELQQAITNAYELELKLQQYNEKLATNQMKYDLEDLNESYKIAVNNKDLKAMAEHLKEIYALRKKIWEQEWKDAQGREDKEQETSRKRQKELLQQSLSLLKDIYATQKSITELTKSNEWYGEKTSLERHRDLRLKYPHLYTEFGVSTADVQLAAIKDAVTENLNTHAKDIADRIKQINEALDKAWNDHVEQIKHSVESGELDSSALDLTNSASLISKDKLQFDATQKEQIKSAAQELFKSLASNIGDAMGQLNLSNLKLGDKFYDPIADKMRTVSAEEILKIDSDFDAIRAEVYKDAFAYVKKLFPQIDDTVLEALKAAFSNDEMAQMLQPVLEALQTSLRDKLTEQVADAYKQFQESIVSTFNSAWDEGFEIGYEYGFTSEGFEALKKALKKRIATTISKTLQKYIGQMITDMITDMFSTTVKDSITKTVSETAAQASKTAMKQVSFLGELVGGLISGIIGTLIGFLIGGLFADITDAIEEQAEEQAKQQRDSINSQGFSWSYSDPETATPYYEFSPPTTQESVKIIKFNTTFNIGVEAASALAAQKRELERVVTTLFEEWTRTAAKTVGARV